MNPPPDPYKILGIAPNVQLADIRAAHRKLVKLCHPDKVGADACDSERKEKDDEFKRVQKAYELLSDENERRKYDEKARIQKRYQDIRRAAASSAAFSQGIPRQAWESGSPPANVDIRTPEQRPDSFSSKSPPRSAPEQYYHTRPTKPSPEQARPDRPKSNIGVKHAGEPRHARPSPGYEPHSSPTEESHAAKRMRDIEEKEASMRAIEMKKQQVAKAERELKKMEKAMKGDKRSTERMNRSKDEKVNRKSKEAYVEEPQPGSEEAFSAKSTHKAKPSSKPHKSHRTSKHDRSRSRSRSRPADKPPKTKESMTKPHFEAEVEEADEQDTGVESGAENVTRQMNTAMHYMGASGIKLKGSKTFHGGDFPPVPCAPTPPPAASSKAPPPPHPPSAERVHPHIIDAEPPMLSRSTTLPPVSSYSRQTPITIPVEPQYAHFDTNTNNGRNRTGRVAQPYYPDGEDMAGQDEMHGRPRSRRGSSNNFPPQPHGYPQGRPMYPVAEGYYPPPTGHYYTDGVAHSPKRSHMAPGPRHHVPGVGPFGSVQTSPNYGEHDVAYSQVPHGYSQGTVFS